MPKMPETLYVAQKEIGHDKFLVASPDLADVIDDDGTAQSYGVYHLAEIMKARKVVEEIDG